MKYLFLIFTLCINHLFAQKKINFEAQYKIDYEFKFLADSLKNDGYGEEKMSLYLGEKFSLFQNSKQSELDSIISLKDATNDRTIDFQSIPILKVKFRILKDYSKNEMLFFEPIENVLLTYTEDLDINKWIILDEKREIIGYKCTKAVTSFRGRNYTAWFSSELPFRDGPYKFMNLPGLIFEISDDKNNFSFSLLSITKIAKNLYFSQNKMKIIKREEFYPIKISYIENLQRRANPTFKYPPIIYNPIELK